MISFHVLKQWLLNSAICDKVFWSDWRKQMALAIQVQSGTRRTSSSDRWMLLHHLCSPFETLPLYLWLFTPPLDTVQPMSITYLSFMLISACSHWSASGFSLLFTLLWHIQFIQSVNIYQYLSINFQEYINIFVHFGRNVYFQFFCTWFLANFILLHLNLNIFLAALNFRGKLSPSLLPLKVAGIDFLLFRFTSVPHRANKAVIEVSLISCPYPC